jgi:hypothetical protein
MAQEDEHSKRMQRIWREQERARQSQNKGEFLTTFHSHVNKLAATTDDKLCMAAQAANDGFVANAEWMQMLVERLEFPENWDIMTMIQQNYWIETQIMLRKHQQRQRELIEKQAQQMQQSQAESLAAWQQCAYVQPSPCQACHDES